MTHLRRYIIFNSITFYICNYKITLLSPEEDNVVLLDYDGFNKKILTFRRGDWVNRLYRYFYHKERCYLQDRAEHPNFQLIQY